MNISLTFNDITFTPVSRQNSLWIRAVELARALGYSSEEKFLACTVVMPTNLRLSDMTTY